ncbi:MAG: NUDIX hydrolase [Clostridia bacterium]|nr:NUDIX hydrolase [Clostridia bacterium]
MRDILFKDSEAVFSYRVAGVCLHDGKVLLQKPTNDSAHAFPGGHVMFGETNEQTLIREFREEIGAEIRVGELMWVGEIFFPWGDRPCHQICLYYAVELTDPILMERTSFIGEEQLENRDFSLEFLWIPINRLSDIEVYPPEARALLEKTEQGIRHFIYREE